MSYASRVRAIGYTACCFTALCGVASAQMVRPLGPSAPVVDGPPVRQAPSPELKNLVAARGIREVTEAPGESSVVISFRAWPSLIPIVEIGREQPVAVAGGRLEFANRLAKVDAKPIPDENEISPTGYTASIPNLESGTRYHYLISVGEGASLRQMRGRFTTTVVRANVTVVFTQLEVTNDSDDGGNGELYFSLFTDGSGACNSFGTNLKPLSWNDNDPPRSLNEVIEIQDAPERIALFVTGYDLDHLTVGGVDVGIPGDPGNVCRQLSGPFNEDSIEGNVAKQTFNLRDFQGDEVRHDFVLDSMSHAAGQGDLSFKVKGYFVIKRERAAP
jgi:hypothetical protein